MAEQDTPPSSPPAGCPDTVTSRPDAPACASGGYEAHGVEVGYATDLGRVRHNNEDRFYLCDQHCSSIADRGLVYAVADGMGGHAGGEFASGTTVEVLDTFYTEPLSGTLEELMRRTIERANEAILARSNAEPDLARMGTTLTAVHLLGGQTMTIWHVGDSRVYLTREGTIKRLTDDHSLVADQVRMGLITEADALVHPARNVITRALGTRIDVRPDVYTYEVQPGDSLLVCSDGLHGVVPEPDILESLAQPVTAQEVCQRLVERANGLGGPDNITVVVVRIKPPSGFWGLLKDLFGR